MFAVLLIFVLGLGYILIEKEKLEIKVYFNATHDGLTGLNNLFSFIDLDAFKDINDTYGHDAGDYCLKEVALRLTHISREVDSGARFGGDEFAVLFCDVDQNGFVQDAAKRINQSIAEFFTYYGQKFNLSCSIGVALAESTKE